ncbi:hypothetical protein M407DRAFT_8410 [Tulasnella calospora MUT 4182]|uniref:DUF6532 domain-containing protein n=1 Tax=Tulasnella calospora MUT 4182 TaxID=1051891 RepID=A0A0C3LVN1_9AGAM|nr:hypothetical protein M407DRAFT_8410 [Tulasnella calospora MUT 4182]
MDKYDDLRPQFNSWREEVDLDRDYTPPGRRAGDRVTSTGTMYNPGGSLDFITSSSLFDLPLSSTSTNTMPPSPVPSNQSLETPRITVAATRSALNSFALRAIEQQGAHRQLVSNAQIETSSEVAQSPVSQLGQSHRRRRYSDLSTPMVEPNAPLEAGTESPTMGPGSAAKRARLPEDGSVNSVPLSLNSAFPHSSLTPPYAVGSFPSPATSYSIPFSEPPSPAADAARSTSATAQGTTWTLNKTTAKKRTSQATPSNPRAAPASQALGCQSRKESRSGPTEGNLTFYSPREQLLIQHMKRLLLGILIASNPWAESIDREKLVNEAFDEGMQSSFADECGRLTLSPGLNRLMIDHISTGRSRIKSIAARVVELHLGLKTDDELDEENTIGREELYKANRITIRTALDANNFVYREYNNRDDRGGIFRSPMIRRVLLAFFDGESSEGALSWRLYAKGIPVPTLAFVCTVLQCTISEWSTGKKVLREFSRVNYKLVCDNFIEGFEAHARERQDYAKETLQGLTRSAGIRAKKISGTDPDEEFSNESTPPPFIPFFSATDRD